MNKVIVQGLIFAAVFFGMWFGLSRVDWMHIFHVKQRTDKTEEKLGEIFWEAFIQSEKEIKNEKIILPVDTLLTKLCEANDIDRKEIKLHVIKSDDINAFAFPNKHLVVFSSLLTDCKSEAELAGVMAHELAHIQKNHVMKKLIKEVGLTALISVTAGKAGGTVIREITKTLTSTAYDRVLESEADMQGIAYLVKAHIDATGLADFLARLGSKEPEVMKHLTLISTHPDSKERADEISAYLLDHEQKPEPVLAPETWEQLKDEVRDRDSQSED